MLIGFFQELRSAKLPVTLREFLDLLGALQKQVVFANMEDFYYLSRTCLIKNESQYDKFDIAFSAYFEGLQQLEDILDVLIPEDWLRKDFEKSLSEEERAKIKTLGGLEELIKQFKQRLQEQKERHQGGSKWIGTGGTSPFGTGGVNPEGIRIGPEGGGGQAVKVWENREFRNLDDTVELGTRNIKLGLRKLRQFARSGAAEELDMDDTISSTARNAGYLDLKLVPERHNAIKVLLFMDVGGSMDGYIRTCEEIFSAARSEFKHLEYFYFHNFIYDAVWRDNRRRTSERTNVYDILNRFGRDYKIIFVGDASMSPFEISHPGGCLEHWNEEAGAKWMNRLSAGFDKLIWLNPSQEKYWSYTRSVAMVQNLVSSHMYPLSLQGLDQGIRYLR